MAKILIVDDSEDVLEIFSIVLRSEGYEIEGLSSKSEVLNRLSTFVPDVILLDVKLRGENGRELCREIKQKKSLKNINIILLSASTEFLKDYEKCGACDIIEKPFNLSTVIEKVKAALSYQPT